MIGLQFEKETRSMCVYACVGGWCVCVCVCVCVCGCVCGRVDGWFVLTICVYFNISISFFSTPRSGAPPHFALSWVLTWFSHDLDDISLICRLYDVCLSGHPLMSLYLATAVS